MLKIKEILINQVIEHAKGSFPHEACGILGGKGDEVRKVYNMTNVSDTAETCYFMDPKEQLNVMKEIRASGLEMVAIYHSHTKSGAYPSAKDMELAFYQDAYYLIISLEKKDKPNCRAFKLKDGKIEETGLSIEE